MDKNILKIVTWKWKPKGEYRSTFKAEHVNTLRNMVKRNVTIPHEFICITDDGEGIDDDITVIPLWENPVKDFGDPKRPNCFYRIKAFSPEMAEIIGKRFMWMDLDTVICGNIDHIAGDRVDFAMWGDTTLRKQYNGSLCLMTAGARKQVWEQFHPENTPYLCKHSGLIGSDQAWITYVLGHAEKKYGREDGIYSYRNHFAKGPFNDLPENARIVFFHGKHDPWDEEVQARHAWIREHYR